MPCPRYLLFRILRKRDFFCYKHYMHLHSKSVFLVFFLCCDYHRDLHDDKKAFWNCWRSMGGDLSPNEVNNRHRKPNRYFSSYYSLTFRSMWGCVIGKFVFFVFPVCTCCFSRHCGCSDKSNCPRPSRIQHGCIHC